MQKIAMLITTVTATLHSKLSLGSEEYNSVEIGSLWWWIYGSISIFLVCFAGMMSGLTLGLMTLSPMDLKVLKKCGTALEQKQAAAITPVLTKQHQLLVTLLLCNAVSMEALPIFLDKMFNEWMTVILSVTFVLAFGEVIPQAICSRYGLAVGANTVWLVNIIMFLCWPIAYPIGRLLDYLLGHDNSPLFLRSQLKALVSIHGKEDGGYLTNDETKIIAGALDLTEKTAAKAMTPIESTFSLDLNSKLDGETLDKIMERGHSRVPVYSERPQNIVGLLLVKNLLKVHTEEKTPVSALNSIRRIPRVPEDMPLYDILNEFQKGGSRMAAVVGIKQNKQLRKFSHLTNFGPKEDKKRVNEHQEAESDIEKGDEKPYNGDEPSSDTEYYQQLKGEADQNHEANDKLKVDVENSDVIGIITMEDVMEELLQEEIVDETDEYIDVHKRIRVAAVATQMGLSRHASMRRPSRASMPTTEMVSKQTQEAVNICIGALQGNTGSIDAIASYVHTDKYPKMEKGLTQPLLGSSCPLGANSKFTKDHMPGSVVIGAGIFTSVVTPV